MIRSSAIEETLDFAISALRKALRYVRAANKSEIRRRITESYVKQLLANAVAAAALFHAYTYNLEMHQPAWHGISIRLITISMAAAGLYFLSRRSTPADTRGA